MKLGTKGRAHGIRRRVVARVVTKHSDDRSGRDGSVLVLEGGNPPVGLGELEGYSALLLSSPSEAITASIVECGLPVVTNVELDHLRTGDVVVIGTDGFVRTLYRPDSSHNSLFATDRCNSNCLMCSQPPRDFDDTFRVDENLELIRLIQEPPGYLGITGGEPTLLGDGLLQILRALRDRFPTTYVHILTNGRRFAWPEFTREFAAVAHPHCTLAIPVYADNATDHDYVVQAKDAFDQTIAGMHRLAQYGQEMEIRVVLHAATVARLRELAEFIYRNLTFARHVTFMGLEYTGYTPHNLQLLWVDPLEYQAQLLQAVRHLALRGMTVSVYNLPLCLLDRALWPFARRSISDWKNIFLPECDHCVVRERCAGLFASANDLQKKRIKAFRTPVTDLSPEEPSGGVQGQLLA